MPGKGYDYGKKDKSSSNPRSPDYDGSYDIQGSRTADELMEKMNNMSQDEYDRKKKLQEQMVLSFLSGLPGIGGFVSGYDRAKQMQDYYKNTGQVPNYYTNIPGGGFSTLGSAVGNALSKIPGGQNDLYQFYAGEPDGMAYM